MAQVTDIKTKLKAHLQALVTASKLASYQSLKFPQEILNLDIGKYPAAVVLPCTEVGQAETNRDNLRTYTYDIVIVQKGENVSNDAAVEELCEAILNEFDNDPTFSGSANGGVLPTASETVATGSGDQTFVLFVITVHARALVGLTF